MMDLLIKNIIKGVCHIPNKQITKILVPIINKIAGRELIILDKMNLSDLKKFDEKTILLHGVSVGEIISLENLVKQIKKEFPNKKIVITAGTKAGLEIAQKKYTDLVDYITYFPLDIKDYVSEFIEKINPCVILIAETEIWPNFLFYASDKKIPLYIINGRMSDKSYPLYKNFRFMFKHILDCHTEIFTQSETDKERFISLGLSKNKVSVMKNLKFEIEKKECDISLNKGNSKVFIAASTHKGEEEVALRAYKVLKEKDNSIKMIIAPRHLKRLDEIEQLVQESDFNYGFRTKGDNLSNCDILILDTVGELAKIYEQTDVSYIGGSFNKLGGHNPLEATIYSKPTISGPSIKNFRDIYAILQNEKASFVVKSEKEFQEMLQKLFFDNEYYKQIATNCERCFNEQQGAVEFVIKKLKTFL